MTDPQRELITRSIKRPESMIVRDAYWKKQRRSSIGAGASISPYLIEPADYAKQLESLFSGNEASRQPQGSTQAHAKQWSVVNHVNFRRDFLL